VEIVRDAFRTEERGIDVRSGIAGAIAVAGPLAIGLQIDDPTAAVVAAIGGLNAALCVPRANTKARVWWASICVLGGAGGLILADAADGSDAALVLVTLVWVAAWGLFRAAGPTGALAGFASSAMLVIYAGVLIAAPLDRRLLWYGLGAVPGAVLMIVARTGGRASLPKRRDVVEALHERALLLHVARLSISVAAGTLLYLLADLEHGYWVPLTTLAVLQPGVHSTHIRSLQRAAGTLVAAVLVIGITAATDKPWPFAVCAGVCAFFLYALRERGYFWLVVLVTPAALLMLSAVHFQGETVAFDRVTDSLVGIVIGLAFAELARLATRIGSPRQPQRGLP
jgi:uncharacterized membrane protein YccC